MKINTPFIELQLAEQGMTRTDLAQKCGISRQGVSLILSRGTCEPRNAGRLAAGLGVPVADIIEGVTM